VGSSLTTPALSEVRKMDDLAALSRDELCNRLAELQRENEALKAIHRTNQVLKQERDMLEAVAEESHTHLAYLDAEFNFVWVNSVYAAGSGRSREELVGHNHFDLFPDAENQATFERVRDTGVPITFEAKPFEFADQPERGITYWDWSLVPLKDRGGAVSGLVFSLQDVTQAKQAQQQLVERNQFITTVFESLAHPFYVINADDFVIKIANSATAGESLVDKVTCYDLAHQRSIPCGGESHVCPLEEIKRTGEPVVTEHTHYDAAGNRRIFEIHGHPILDSAGNVSQVIEYMLDITDRTQAEEALRESEQKLRNVIEQSNDGIALFDRWGTILEFNASMERITGLARDDAISQPLWDVLFQPAPEKRGAPARHRDPKQLFDEVVNSQQPAKSFSLHENEIQRPDGGRRTIQASLFPIHVESETLFGSIVRDITDQKQMEKELQRERDFTAAVLNTAGALVLVLDPEGRIVRFNRACERLTGYTFAEVEGRLFWDLFLLPDEVPAVKGVFAQLQAGQFPNRHENHWHSRDGNERLIAWSNTALTDPQGAVEYIIASGIDVTARRDIEVALRESERQYRLFIENAQEGVWAIDARANTSFVNRRMAEMLGYTVEEMLGQPLFAFMDEKGIQQTRRNLERRRQGIKEQHDFELICKDGTRIYTSMETSPILDEREQYAGALALVADVTERRRAEEALRQAHDELEMRVQERTAELQLANEALQAEILERRQAEKELRSSEERFRQLAENINEVFWVTDLHQNRMLYISPVYEELWGRSCASLYEDPDSFLDAVHPDDRERVLQAMAQESRAETETSFRILRPDGVLRWVRARTFPIRDESGTAYRVAGIAEDVTERETLYQNLEQRVRERTHELSTLLDISRHVALTLDLDLLLDLILDHLQAVVDYDDATILRLDGDKLIPLAHRGDHPQEMMLGQDFSLERVPFGHQMILSREPIIIPDVRASTRLAQDFRQVIGQRRYTIYEKVSSWMGVPLTLKDQVLGLLTLKYREPDFYTTAQTELVAAFATQAAVAIENHRLYERAQMLAAMEERQRLARDLHDAVSQTLFSASLSAEVLPRLWERKPEEGQRCLNELQLLTRGALAEMRALLLELRPAALLEASLSDLMRQLVEATAGRARLDVDFYAEGSCTLPPDVQVPLYRIAQEALNNLTKHAAAGRARVHINCAQLPGPHTGQEPVSRFELLIQDDGRGFDPGQVKPDHMGLSIMRERAEAIGAALDIQTKVGRGTRVHVVWPNTARAADGKQRKDEP
jgi:PAS domain S-box-containing protein